MKPTDISLKVWAHIQAAMVAAMDKHGPLSTDPVRACAILGREWGEAMDEALLATRPLLHPARSDKSVATAADVYPNRNEAIDRMYAELAQVAATAITIMECIVADKAKERG